MNSVVISNTAASSFPQGLESLPVVAVAALIWYVEAQRRNGQGFSMPQCSGSICKFAPEAAGLIATALVATLLCQYFGGQSVQSLEDEQERMIAESIEREWPILTSADSLLAIQAMIRVFLTASAVLRRDASSSLKGEPALLFFLASFARVVMVLVSADYNLDGPLGGLPNILLEAVGLQLWLLLLNRDSLRGAPKLVGSIALGAVALAGYNQLAISEDPGHNMLFVLVQVLECLAAIAYLIRTVACTGGRESGFASFVHVLLPIQQGLSMYYFLLAFDYAPELVSIGRPFLVLRLGSALQVGSYLLAALLHFVVFEAESGGAKSASADFGLSANVVF